MTRTVLLDSRWGGRHGIGRHADEVRQHLRSPHVALRGRRVEPASAFDPAHIAVSARRVGAGLFYTPGFNAGMPGSYLQLLTVHDLIHLSVRAETSVIKSAYYRGLVLPAVRRTGAVLTVSEYSRKAIHRWSGLAIEKIVNIGNGCSAPLATPSELSEGREAARPFVLFVGNPKAHKNPALFFRAMKLLPDFRAVVVGLSPAVARAHSDRAGLSRNSVDVLVGIDNERLYSLYARAAAVAVPSVEEGFGLVALEALARGTATAYCCDAVGEVVGDLGSRADAHDVGEFARALERAASTSDRDRAALVARAALFSWAEVASKVDATIEMLAS